MDNTVTIKNFNLNLFGNLLNQSLSVTNQLMLEFNNGFLKSCSFSQTKSLIKLWTIPYQQLIHKKPTDENILEDPAQVDMFKENVEEEELILETFNFYILRGDSFRNYISVFGGDSVDLTFKLIENKGKKQATSLIINGKSTNGTPLKIEFPLTTEELITNVISDYSEILKACTPEETFKEFVLDDKQIIEIRGLIKKLKTAGGDNTAYLSFCINNDVINIKDKVFNLSYQNNKFFSAEKFEFNFNILKSDFLLLGDHNFSIFTNNDTQKVIFGAKYNNAIIWCMSTKVGDYTTTEESFDDDDDSILDSLGMEEYADI